MPRRPYASLEPKTGNRIRYWRMRLGMTIDDLAEATGISARTIQKYETLPGRLRVDQLPVFATALGVDPSDLVESGQPLSQAARDLARRFDAWTPEKRRVVEQLSESLENWEPKTDGAPSRS